jgi:hypothetical protein
VLKERLELKTMLNRRALGNRRADSGERGLSVLVVSLLLIAALVAGLLVALVDPKVARRLLGRLHVGGSQSSPDGTSRQ